ncbi:MAG: secretin N-terminal domain-containing protein, partial [Myxococcota bacterium]
MDLSRDDGEHEVRRTTGGLWVGVHASTAAEPPRAPAPIPTPSPALARADVCAVSGVRFEGDSNKARVILGASASCQPRIDDRSSKSWVLELGDATLPKALERSLDTTAYGSVVRMVSAYQASSDPAMINVVVALQGKATQKVSRRGGELIWEIQGEKDAPAIASTSAPQTAGFAAEAATVARTIAPVQTDAAEASRKRRITIDLKDAEIVNVLRLISEVSGENIVTSDDIKGKITLRLRNVPWDTALETILHTKGYGKVRYGNILRIAPAEQINKEKELEVAHKRNQIEAEETVIKMVTVNYASAKEIETQLKAMLTGRGTIQIDERTNTIILEEVTSNIDRVVELTRRLDRQTPQVLIEARIVEASSNNLQELGIQWGGTGQATSRTGNPTGLQFPGNIVASGGADDARANVTTGTGSPGRYAVNLPAPVGAGLGGSLGFIFGSAGGSQLLNLRLSALEENGSGRILSSPRKTTLH